MYVWYVFDLEESHFIQVVKISFTFPDGGIQFDFVLDGFTADSCASMLFLLLLRPRIAVYVVTNM